MLKRSAMQRPLAQGQAITRSTRLAPVNRERKAKVFARNFGERAKAVRAMVCLVIARNATVALGTVNRYEAWEHSASRCSSWLVQAAHVRARGMGGAKGDRRDLVPLCDRHHRESGEFRTSQRTDFERRYGLDLQAEAARIAAELDEKGLP